MAESVCRSLRDGALEGELAPALTIKDSLSSPFGFNVFSHILVQLSSHIVAGKSQSRGMVIVSLSRSPSSYTGLLKMNGVDVESSKKWIHILDCYTDPLGWKDKTRKSGDIMDPSNQILSSYKTVKDVNKLFSVICDLGRGLVGENKSRFCVAIDSLSELLRHSSMQSVASLLSNLRSHDQISSIFGLLHSDLHEERALAAVEYTSSIVASVDPFHHSVDGQGSYIRNSSEPNLTKGKLNIRSKRRNGRVRVTCEEFKVGPSGISFAPVSAVDGAAVAGLIPKVQFNLQLSEKELVDRSRVVLPFEHQGNGKPIQIYDGRRSLEESNNETTPPISGGKKEESGRGEIIYFRDSDDEMPDSDEDPDDDLDI